MEDISRWEGEGGALKQAESKENPEGGRLVEVPKFKSNECLSFMADVMLKTIVRNREYITKRPTREYIGTELICVSSTDSLTHVAEALAKHGISCVPVIESGVFKGFVDTLDIVTFIVMRSQEPFEENKSRGDEMKRAGREIASTPVSCIIDQCHKNPAIPICEDHPVTAALEVFAKGIHRVPLFDTNKKLVGLCSQSDLIQFLSEQFTNGFAEGISKKSLRQFGCMEWGPQSSVLKILPTATVQHAIAKMVMAPGVRALAVVSPDGVLLGSFSAHNIAHAFHERTDQQELFVRLGMTVRDYLEAYSPELMQPLFDLPDISLKGACKEMADHHAHCLWLVDSLETMRPVALCSLTDICRVVQHFKWPSGICK